MPYQPPNNIPVVRYIPAAAVVACCSRGEVIVRLYVEDEQIIKLITCYAYSFVG